MEASTFNDPRVVELASQFVCVMVDAESEPEICRRLHVSGFPTVQLISPAGLSLGRMAGLQAAPNFVKSLRAALERYAVLETRAVVR
jgi:hypothetical protein